MVTDPVSERQSVIDAAEQNQYDLVVIGGGIAGAGVARDAAMRGIDTLLVEQEDFASGTTAYTTRLIHGGLRYLEHYDFRLVFESLQERETLAEIAPHLVDELTFLIPEYDTSRWRRVKVRLGMYLYDLLSVGKTMPNHERVSSSEILDLEPALPSSGLQGGYLYHDRQAEFIERLCLETILDAEHRGADVLNHAQAAAIRTDGCDVSGIAVRDRLGETRFEVDATAVLNATGPWADEVVDSSTESKLIRPTKGIHIVVPRLTDHALTLPATDDRVVFVVPWYEYSLIGTTDTDFDEDPATARASASDVEYLLEQVGRFFPDLDFEDIAFSYAGVRPLMAGNTEQEASAVSRRHTVVEHDDTYRGLFSLIGAKVTQYRRAAEDATDVIADYLDIDTPCETATVPLPGARGVNSRPSQISDSVLGHLESVYGSRADRVLDRIESDPSLLEPLCEHSDDIRAQVTVAVEEEYARRLSDVMFRRCTIGFAPCEGRDAADTVADHMASLLDWDESRRNAELQQYEAEIAQRHAYEEEVTE